LSNIIDDVWQKKNNYYYNISLNELNNVIEYYVNKNFENIVNYKFPLYKNKKGLDTYTFDELIGIYKKENNKIKFNMSKINENIKKYDDYLKLKPQI